MANPENLKPWPKGTSGNPNGRPKGVKNLSTLIQQLLADEKLMDTVVKNKKKPEYWDSLPNKNMASAVIMAIAIKALQGDTQAAAWIAKYGYGDKLVHEFEDGLFQATKLEIEIVKSKAQDERDPES